MSVGGWVWGVEGGCDARTGTHTDKQTQTQTHTHTYPALLGPVVVGAQPHTAPDAATGGSRAVRLAAAGRCCCCCPCPPCALLLSDAAGGWSCLLLLRRRLLRPALLLFLLCRELGKCLCRVVAPHEARSLQHRMEGWMDGWIDRDNIGWVDGLIDWSIRPPAARHHRSTPPPHTLLHLARSAFSSAAFFSLARCSSCSTWRASVDLNPGSASFSSCGWVVCTHARMHVCISASNPCVGVCARFSDPPPSHPPRPTFEVFLTAYIR